MPHITASYISISWPHRSHKNQPNVMKLSKLLKPVWFNWLLAVCTEIMGIPINRVYPFLISYPQKHILQYLWHRTLYGVPIIVVFQVKIWFI